MMAFPVPTASITDKFKTHNKISVSVTLALIEQWQAPSRGPLLELPYEEALVPHPLPSETSHLLLITMMHVCSLSLSLNNKIGLFIRSYETAKWEKITYLGMATCSGLAFYILSKGHPHHEEPPPYPYLHIRNKEFPWGPNGLFEVKDHH
ncbi:hypothetical protein Ahy_B05g079756 [Arachis hypogaea]|uniref:Cytochrome c oxidase subunit 6a n=1 Tax=Arachis hypogaea TaxID=3818 RepID=A0A444ZAT2_ARAHY|nr:hypothetical protein Ahy_B05g079756 [Arachis hypogaea]